MGIQKSGNQNFENSMYLLRLIDKNNYDISKPAIILIVANIMNTYIYKHTHTHTHTYIYIHIYTYINIHIHIHIYAYVCTNVIGPCSLNCKNHYS